MDTEQRTIDSDSALAKKRKNREHQRQISMVIHTNTREEGDDKWSNIPTRKDFVLTLRTQDHQTTGFRTGITQNLQEQQTEPSPQRKNNPSNITSKKTVQKQRKRKKATEFHKDG